MPILIKNNEEFNAITSSDYTSERELQEILADNPALLVNETDPPIALVQTEVNLPNTGKADILFVDSSGLPIVVEVKLAKNAESRREIVAQIFDYISSITQFTVDELDDLTGSQLLTAINSLSDKNNSTEQIWKLCSKNLRAGDVRVVLAIDKAPNELVRIVRFVNEKSVLDVRLVELQKFSNDKSKAIIVPNFIVIGEETKTVVKEKRPKRPPEPVFQNILDSYAKIAVNGFETIGNTHNYRQIKILDWPQSIHYEFYSLKYTCGIEIHLEHDRVKPIADLLINFSKTLVNKFPNGKVKWDQKWHRGRGRLMVQYDNNINPMEIAKGMKKLVGLTNEKISKELQNIGVI